MYTHAHTDTRPSLRAEPMTVAQQGPLRHLCRRNITYTHYSFGLLAHIYTNSVQCSHTRRETVSVLLSVFYHICMFIEISSLFFTLTTILLLPV